MQGVVKAKTALVRPGSNNVMSQRSAVLAGKARVPRGKGQMTSRN